MSNKDRISFSELKIWNECAYKHKLIYIDDLKSFVGNEYTAFGTAMHLLCEKAIYDPTTKIDVFETKLELEFEQLNIKDDKLLQEMKKQGQAIAPEILPAVESLFPTKEIFSVEEQIYETIADLVPGAEIVNFKGFIDLVLKTPDGKYHIIDWKTCSWGWDRQKRNDKILAYQLVLYKYFFSLKHGIDIANINTYFALLKRTAKSKKVEIFQVSSGKKRTADALSLLKKAIFNINGENFLKNRLSCRRCEFHNTENCT